MIVENDMDVDKPDPLTYAHSVLDPAKVLAELGFKHGGTDENDLDFWIKKLSPRIIIAVNVDNQTGYVNYRKVRLANPKKLEGSFQVLDCAFGVPILELRKLMQQKTEAQEVIHRLLDADDDALDPRGELERLKNDRCPNCGSRNISHAEGEAITDCYACGNWFQSDICLPAQEALEDEIPDVKDYALRHGAKPFGYVLRSQLKDSPYPWMNTRWSDRSDCCGNFRRHIGDATVFKRQSTVKGYTSLDAVPVYSDPRKTGNRALSPNSVAENAEDPDDPNRIVNDFIQKAGELRPRITISFSQTTPESAAEGDHSDSGWIDEEGVEMIPDNFDYEEGLSAVDLAVKFLDKEGAWHASSSHFYPGVWYSTEYSTIDYRTGTDEERCFHLKDFSDEEQREIWNKLHKLWRREPR